MSPGRQTLLARRGHWRDAPSFAGRAAPSEVAHTRTCTIAKAFATRAPREGSGSSATIQCLTMTRNALYCSAEAVLPDTLKTTDATDHPCSTSHGGRIHSHTVRMPCDSASSSTTAAPPRATRSGCEQPAAASRLTNATNTQSEKRQAAAYGGAVRYLDAAAMRQRFASSRHRELVPINLPIRCAMLPPVSHSDRTCRRGAAPCCWRCWRAARQRTSAATPCTRRGGVCTTRCAARGGGGRAVAR